MTSDLQSEVKIFSSLTLHDVCWNIGFLGPGIHKWHYFFHFDLIEVTNDLWPLIRGQNFEITNFAWCMLKYRFFVPRNPKMTLFFHFDLIEMSPNDLWPPIRGQNFQFTNFAWCMLKYRFFGPRNPKMTFFHFDLKEVNKWPLTSNQRSKFSIH